MNMISYKGKTLLHLIDCIDYVAEKNPETILTCIFKIWISVYGSPKNFLTDNGGECADVNFIEMCEALRITLKTTAVESPWSNALVERYKLILLEILTKILEDTKCYPDLVVA